MSRRRHPEPEPEKIRSGESNLEPEVIDILNRNRLFEFAANFEAYNSGEGFRLADFKTITDEEYEELIPREIPRTRLRKFMSRRCFRAEYDVGPANVSFNAQQLIQGLRTFGIGIGSFSSFLRSSLSMSDFEKFSFPDGIFADLVESVAETRHGVLESDDSLELSNVQQSPVESRPLHLVDRSAELHEDDVRAVLLEFMRVNKVPGTLLVATVGGSYAYNLDLPTSDRDYIGVFAFPTNLVFSLRQPKSVYSVNTPQDLVLYEVRNFCENVLKSNPLIIQVLLAKRSLWMHDLWRTHLMPHVHDLVLTKKSVLAYSGYVRCELKRVPKQFLVPEGSMGPVTEDERLKACKLMYHAFRLVMEAERLLSDPPLEPMVCFPDDSVERAFLMAVRLGTVTRRQLMREDVEVEGEMSDLDGVARVAEMVVEVEKRLVVVKSRLEGCQLPNSCSEKHSPILFRLLDGFLLAVRQKFCDTNT